MTSPYKSDQCLEHIDFGYLWLIRLSSENILNADLFATCLIPIDHTDVPECVKRDLPGMEHFPNCSQEARILFLGRNQLYSKNEKCHLGRQMFYVVVSCPSLPVYMYVYIIDIIWYIYIHIHTLPLIYRIFIQVPFEYHLIDFGYDAWENPNWPGARSWETNQLLVHWKLCFVDPYEWHKWPYKWVTWGKKRPT